MDKHYLTALFCPESIAVFAGQADQPETMTPQAVALHAALRAQRYSGTLRFLDIHTSGTLADLAQARADLAIIALPPQDVAAALDIAGRMAALATDADPWLAKAAQGFLAGSPTSAALGLELQRRARNLSLADVFRLEWQASVGCCAHTDFAEGVRALLIDKDKQPRWQPATLAEVTPAWIADHLQPRYQGAHPLADLV